MDRKKNKVYLLLGGNIGNVKNQFLSAISRIIVEIGPIVKQSKYYQSEPWGFESPHIFLNQVIELETNITAYSILKITQSIEIQLGRKPNNSNKEFESRAIDIDILYFNNLIINKVDLTIPHYALHLRRFTLVPLIEVAPDFVHPICNKTNRQLLADCPDKSQVTAI